MLTLSTSQQSYDFPWMMPTYDLDIPADCRAVVEQETNNGGHGMWIYKPACSNRGRGISVLKGLAELQELCFPSPPSGSESEKELTSPSVTISLPSLYRNQTKTNIAAPKLGLTVP